MAYAEDLKATPADCQIAETANTSEDRAITRPESTHHKDVVGQSGGIGTSKDAVESALASALEGATAAGQWQVVGQLARELEARRVARSANVHSLDAARKKQR